MPRKIKVGLDISQAAHQGGVAVYTENLAKSLSKLDELDMVYFYSSLRKPYQQAVSSAHKGELKNVKNFKLPPTLFEVLFNRLRNVSIEKFLGPIDVYHSSDWVQPPSKAKNVTTYHDVIPLKYPQWSHPKVVAVHKKRLNLVENEVDMVIAVSESTKKDLLEVSNIPADKIRVIYEGVEDIFRSQGPAEIEGFKKKFNLPKNYLLAIGGVGERKNLERIKKAAKNYVLITLGRDIQMEREELPFLYAGADALVYASLYEGFGLPILEAMAVGTPVLTSNVSSMPEIAGDGAILVDPENVSEIEKGIEKVLEQREKLIKLGFERAKQFSWEKCAKETAEVYRDLMNE